MLVSEYKVSFIELLKELSIKIRRNGLVNISNVCKTDWKESFIEKLKIIVQDCNINLLLGSGLSAPYLSTLGNIEQLLTALADYKGKGKITEIQEKIIRASIYKKYFSNVIYKNLSILHSNDKTNDVLENYKNLLIYLNSIIFRRKSTILNKQINLFTTNIDVFLEKSLEETGLEFNDGFSGRYHSVFDLRNFGKLVFKTSLHYNNTFELPVFNLFKMHGSLTWEKDRVEIKSREPRIIFSPDLRLIKRIKKVKIPHNKIIHFDNEEEISELIEKSINITSDVLIDSFITEYEKLAIVNPTKEKFRETVLNRNYYEILRIYSNELEKENTVLFVMGFSFADEHIRDITVRVANSNPTLKLFVFSFLNEISEGMQILEKESINSNIEIITPNQFIADEENDREFTLNLENIVENIFIKLLSNDERGFVNKKRET